MTILYKYYSSYSKNIFIKPNLKLTPPSHLNDPFERKIPHGIESIILDSPLGYAIAENLQKKNIKNKEVHTINVLEKTLGRIGITAMSESSDNILMWSHYANSHSGICIGYDTSKIKNDHMRLLKVDYSTNRFKETDITQKMSNLSGMIDRIIDKVITTKSNEWSYENEHRYITNLSYANGLLIATNKDEANHIVDILESQNQYKYLYDALDITNSNNNVMIKAKIKHTIEPELVQKLTEYKCISFFKEVNQECIKEIYIGCNSTISVNNVLSDINSEGLMSVKVNKYKMSDDRFKLEIIN